ncbi:MAG: hypothetical protein ACXVXZ_10840, partial [Mycobacteriaceae bacterium]
VLLILRTIRSARASRSQELPAHASASAFNQQQSPSTSPAESASPGGHSGGSPLLGGQPAQP